MVRAMLAAPVLDLTPSPHRRRAWVPLVLSAVLHLLLALVWMGFPMPEHHAEEPVIQVELTAAPPPAPAPQSESGHKAAAPRATEQGIPVPQLEEGILAQRSSRPLVKEPDTAPAAPQARPEPKPEPKPKKPPPVTQNERDFVLGQVMRHWVQPKELSARDDKAHVRLAVTVGPDGYFRDIYDSRRPWNPVEVFDGYNSLPPNSLERRTIDALLRAVRQAQPVKLPPALREKAPFEVRLDFRFKDVR